MSIYSLEPKPDDKRIGTQNNNTWVVNDISAKIFRSTSYSSGHHQIHTNSDASVIATTHPNVPYHGGHLWKRMPSSDSKAYHIHYKTYLGHLIVLANDRWLACF
jgi:hypothetical protein